MTTHAKQPDMAHQALLDQLHGVLDRFAGMPKIEQIALMAQAIGGVITELPAGSYSPGDVLQAVAANIAAGNDQAARSVSNVIGSA